MRVNGRTTDGYQVYLGADLDEHEIADVVGRVAEADLDAAVTAIVGTWEALRHPGESLGRTVRRFTAEAFSQQITAALAERWAAGPEPAAPATPSESAVLVSLTLARPPPLEEPHVDHHRCEQPARHPRPAEASPRSRLMPARLPAPPAPTGSTTGDPRTPSSGRRPASGSPGAT